MTKQCSEVNTSSNEYQNLIHLSSNSINQLKLSWKSEDLNEMVTIGENFLMAVLSGTPDEEDRFRTLLYDWSNQHNLFALDVLQSTLKHTHKKSLDTFKSINLNQFI